MHISALPEAWPAKCVIALILSTSQDGQCQQDSGQYVDNYERVWAVPALYDNADNLAIQSFSLVGRYHGQFWNVDADQGDAEDWEDRRWQMGFSSKWFQHFTMQAQMYVNTGAGSVYDGLYEAFISWSPPDTDFSLSVGRLDYLFTGFERSKSSKKINTIERGLLVNQLMPAEVVGAHMQGRHDRFSYHVGLFSRSIEDEFDDFDTGAAAVVGTGYDAALFYDEGSLHLDYLYNDRKSEGNAFKPYRHIISL